MQRRAATTGISLLGTSNGNMGVGSANLDAGAAKVSAESDAKRGSALLQVNPVGGELLNQGPADGPPGRSKKQFPVLSLLRPS